MKIVFDTDLRVAGIGLVPWTRLGPEQWLPNYAIASLYGWDVVEEATTPRVLALSARGELPVLERLNTQSLLRTEAFRSLLQQELAGYDLLTYKPVSIPPELADRKFLMVDPAFTARYENKVTFRQLCEGRITFPPFAIHDRAALADTPEAFARLLGDRPGMVIQDEQLSGGKGTFLVRDYGEYRAALQALGRLSHHRQVVISDLVENARERSLQCCVTKQGVFTGPLQRQIVRHPLLANVNVPDGDKFCGAQILAEDQGSPVHQAATEAARQIGRILQAEGYRGIFGVDFLLDGNGELLVLEINPRITGVTPLLTALFGRDEGMPFYLLHLLELGGYDYRITDETAIFDKTGALLVMHSLQDEEISITQMPSSGTYRLAEGALERVSPNIRLTALRSDEFVFQEYMPKGMRIKPGGRLATLQFSRQVIDTETDKLYNDVSEIINVLQRTIHI